MEKKSLTTKIVLAFFLVGLPFGSFLYLRSGLDFFKENMSMLEVKAQMPDFTAQAANGFELSRDSLKGRVYVVNFFNTACKEDCQKTTDQLLRINTQFKNKEEVLLLSFSTQADADSLPALNAFAKQKGINQKKWLLLRDEASKVKAMASAAGETFESIPVERRLLLVDADRNIRNVYDAQDEKAFNDMVTHITLIMPPTPRKDFEFRRDKEY